MLPVPRPRVGQCDHMKLKPAAYRQAKKLLFLPDPNGLGVISMMLLFLRLKGGLCSYQKLKSALCPLASKLTLTQPKWSSSVFWDASILTSQSQTVRSQEAEASCLPSGEKAIVFT